MKVQMTKQAVKDALREETLSLLQPGHWLYYTLPMASSLDNQPAVENCPRCAVGAVILRVLDHRQPALMLNRAIARAAGADDIAGFSYSISPDDYTEWKEFEVLYEAAAERVHAGYPMVGLSYLFEGLCKQVTEEEGDDISVEQMEGILHDMQHFITNTFPEVLVLDINGAAPAQDAVIVEEP